MHSLAVSLVPTLMSDVGNKGWTSLDSLHIMTDPVVQQAANLQWQHTLQTPSPVASSSIWLSVQVQVVPIASLNWTLFPSLAVREPYWTKFEAREEAFLSMSESTSLQPSSLWEHPATACSNFQAAPHLAQHVCKVSVKTLPLIHERVIWSLSLGNFRNIKLFWTTLCCLGKIALHILSISE